MLNVNYCDLELTLYKIMTLVNQVINFQMKLDMLLIFCYARKLTETKTLDLYKEFDTMLICRHFMHPSQFAA